MRKFELPNSIIVAVLLCSIYIFNSCQKESSQSILMETSQIREAVNKWLDSKENPLGSGRVKWLSDLKSSLEFNKAYIENSSNNEEFIVVPLKKTFESSFNKEGDKRSFLVLTVSENNEIKRENIVLFKPDLESTILFKDVFTKMIHQAEVNIDGSFTFLGMWDRFLFSAVYKDKTIFSLSTIQAPEKEAEFASRSSCTAWYLVTTYYDANGNVLYTDEVLISVICDNSNCPPGDPNCTDTGDNSDPGDSGGGNGGNEQQEEIEECLASFNNLSFETSSGKLGVEICGTGPNSRTKCYSWKIYTISGGTIPMYFVSKEQGLQSNNGSSWQFNTFVHNEITKAGVEILYSASITDVVATPSLKKSGMITYYDMAQMHLSFTAKVSVICDGLPIVFNDPTSTQNVWHVNE